MDQSAMKYHTIRGIMQIPMYTHRNSKCAQYAIAKRTDNSDPR